MARGIKRSKGCRTCRARKLGCDEQRPRCRRCRRSNLQCEGYDETTVFIVETLEQAQHATVCCAAASQAISPTEMLRTPAEPYYIKFLVDKLSVEEPGDESGFSWLSMGLNTADTNSMEAISSRSLAQAFFGQYYQLPDVTRDAEATYGHLLRTLRQKLEAGKSMHEANLLHVILSSAVFEIVRRNADESGWEAHTKGLSQIIQMRGPKSFHHAGSAALFEVARSFIVAEGVKNSHEIFLNQEQWKIKRTSSKSKSWKSTLGELSCQLPSIAAELEEWRNTHGEAAGLTAKVVHLLEEAFEWRWRWEIAHGACVKEADTNPRSNLFSHKDGTPIFKKVLRFEKNFLASAITSYDALLIYILNSAEELLGKGWQQVVDVEIPKELSNNYISAGSPLLLPSQVHSVSQVFTELFRTLEGQLDPEIAVPGDAFRLLLPLFVAGRGVQADCVEARYLQMATAEMANMTGFAAFYKKGQEDKRYFKPKKSNEAICAG